MKPLVDKQLAASQDKPVRARAASRAQPSSRALARLFLEEEDPGDDEDFGAEQPAAIFKAGPVPSRWLGYCGSGQPPSRGREVLVLLVARILLCLATGCRLMKPASSTTNPRP